MIERRKFMRFDAILDVFYAVLGYPSNKVKSYSVNVSREGIRFTGKSPLKRGSLIELEFLIPGNKIPLTAIGEVAWSSNIGKSRYDAGIKFTKIDTDDRLKLLDFAYDSWLKIKDKAGS